MVTYEDYVKRIEELMDYFKIIDYYGNYSSSLSSAKAVLYDLYCLRQFKLDIYRLYPKFTEMREKLIELINLLKKCKDDYCKVKSKSYYEDYVKKCGIFENVDRIHLLLSNTIEGVNTVKDGKIPNLISECESKVTKINSLLDRSRARMKEYDNLVRNVEEWIRIHEED